GRAPLVPDEVEVAVGRAHRDLELAGEVGGLDGLARLEALDSPEHAPQGRSCRGGLGLRPAGGAPLWDGHGSGEPYTQTAGRRVTAARHTHQPGPSSFALPASA